MCKPLVILFMIKVSFTSMVSFLLPLKRDSHGNKMLSNHQLGKTIHQKARHLIGIGNLNRNEYCYKFLSIICFFPLFLWIFITTT